MAQLAAHQEQLDKLEIDVVLICFEGRNFAGPWLREMDVSFTMLIDRSRVAYQAYGLERSFWRSWGLKNLWYYAKALLNGRGFRRPQGDSTQLGGDFLVDRHGILRLVYPSEDPTDRPEVDQILSVQFV